MELIRGKRWLAAVLLFALGLAGCAPAASGTATTQATLIPTLVSSPTRAPLDAPAMQSLALGSYTVGMIYPGSLGIVLAPTALPPGNYNPSALPQTLSFYRYSTQAVEQIATTPTLSIVGAAYGGDWVAYAIANKSDWSLWAFNVSTGERIQVDSQAQEAGSAPWAYSLVTTGSDLVWVVQRQVASSSPTGQTDSTLYDFSYVTRQRQTLYAAQATTVTALAMNDAAILLTQIGQQSGGAATYLLERGSSSPVQISGLGAGHAAMNTHFAVWDDLSTSTLTLYDLATGEATTEWAQCYQPAISSTMPYVVCNQPATGANLLVRTPDGATATYPSGITSSSDLFIGPNQIYQGRAYFITASGGLQYLDLPAQ